MYKQPLGIRNLAPLKTASNQNFVIDYIHDVDQQFNAQMKPQKQKETNSQLEKRFENNGSYGIRTNLRAVSIR